MFQSNIVSAKTIYKTAFILMALTVLYYPARTWFLHASLRLS
jgi:hypothetical protein